MTEQKEYVVDKLIEKKGKMKWDKYQQRHLRLLKNATLEYWTVESPEKPSELKGTINLLIEGLNELKPNTNKGTLYKFGWQLQTNSRTYLFASASDNERKAWSRQIQDIFATNKNNSNTTSTTQPTTTTKKTWGSAFEGMKKTMQKQGVSGVGAAFKMGIKDASVINKQNKVAKTLAAKEKRKVIATLDTSSIFGCYEYEDEDKKNQDIDTKQEDGDYDDLINPPNKHKLMTLTLDELSTHGVNSFGSKVGCKASKFNNITSFNDDLVVSNEFCQFAIGKGLIRSNKKRKTINTNTEIKTETETETETEEKKDNKPLKINKRPMHDASDDEKEEMEDDTRMPTPTIVHNGTLREKINFRPGTKDFSICCEIYCENVAATNTVLSNRSAEGKGIEIIAPREGSRRVAVWMEGNILLNVGKTELFQQIWYHLCIVCKRANTGNVNGDDGIEEVSLADANKKSSKFKLTQLGNMSGKEMVERMTGKATIKAAATDFEVFLNGNSDGKLSLDGCPALDTMDCRIGSNVEMSMSSSFKGEIKNFMIFDQALNEEEIYTIAHKKSNMSYSEPRLLSYKPQSLKVQVPICNVKYNGPIHTTLPQHTQWQPDMEPFTISAWIMCSRAVSPNGSVIISNLTTSDKGFQLVCPSKTKKVIGIQCTGIKTIQKKIIHSNAKQKNKKAHNVGKFVIGSTATKAITKMATRGEDVTMPIGTTAIGLNKFYHIAITVEHVIRYGSQPESTIFVCYVNGKADGSFTQNVLYSYSGNEWTIGYNGHYKQETRFEGSIANLRFFPRCLSEAEIACIYAADLRERTFNKNNNILYGTIKQDGDYDDLLKYTGKKGDDIIKSNQHITYFDKIKWCKGKFISNDMSEGKVKILDNRGNEKKLAMNEIMKAKGLKYVPGSDAKNVTNLGGMITGVDFNGNKWRIFSFETKFLQHITGVCSFTSLVRVRPFPKHAFQSMIEDDCIKNKYITNRLLYSAHELLKNINGKYGKGLWKYFNEYILPWQGIWCDQKSFNLLQDVARRLQYKYKKMQFDLFDELKKTNWDVFNIKNVKHDTIENRQDGYKGGLTIEIDDKIVSKDISLLYDKQVASHLLWGRCFVLNTPFQQFMEKIFSNDKFGYHAGPQKTYERMVEKTVEYQSEGAKFPAAFRICDVLRCSIKCGTLSDVTEAFNVLKNNVTIVRIKNRFSPEFDSKETDGYRDMLVNVLYEDPKTKLSAICEVQLQLAAYLEIKKKQHKYYKIVRAVDAKSLLRNYEARKFD